LFRVSTPFRQYFAGWTGVDGRDMPGQDDEINQFEIWIRSPVSAARPEMGISHQHSMIELIIPSS
jgi:hypothetical protein